MLVLLAFVTGFTGKYFLNRTARSKMRLIKFCFIYFALFTRQTVNFQLYQSLQLFKYKFQIYSVDILP